MTDLDEGWVCPAPLRDSPTIVMGHGGGGAMSGELIEHLFLPAFGAAAAAELGDSAVLTVGRRAAGLLDRLVRGEAAGLPRRQHRRPRRERHGQRPRHGGREPLFLSTAFILEEGTALADSAGSPRRSARRRVAAGVQLVTGDTKVVDAGHGDGVFVNTAGIGRDRRRRRHPARRGRAPATWCWSAATSACTGSR